MTLEMYFINLFEYSVTMFTVYFLHENLLPERQKRPRTNAKLIEKIIIATINLITKKHTTPFRRVCK